VEFQIIIFFSFSFFLSQESDAEYHDVSDELRHRRHDVMNRGTLHILCDLVRSLVETRIIGHDIQTRI